jgi:hypothetical protein
MYFFPAVSGGVAKKFLEAKSFQFISSRYSYFWGAIDRRLWKSLLERQTPQGDSKTQIGRAFCELK